jgi:hypothetical protein
MELDFGVDGLRAPLAPVSAGVHRAAHRLEISKSLISPVETLMRHGSVCS